MNDEQITTYPLVNLHAHAPGDGITLLDVSPGPLPDAFPGGPSSPCTLGVHPMTLRPGIEPDWQALRSAWDDTRCLAIGECGLDRRSPLPVPDQLPALRRQILEADLRGKPLLLHCVRAYPELIALRRSSPSCVPWIVHGYNNNLHILRQLLAHDFYISLGAALLDPASPASLGCTAIPLSRLFLETDTRSLPIASVYAAASARLSVPLPVLRQQLYTNFNTVFHGMVR